MKKIVFCLILPCLLCSCSVKNVSVDKTTDTNYIPNYSEKITTATTSSVVDNTTNIITTPKFDKQSDQETFNGNCTKKVIINTVELLDPFFSNCTIEELPKEWNEDNVSVAWEMLDSSKIYKKYTDRVFCDIDTDGKIEMLLTSYSTNEIYTFKNYNNDVKLIDTALDIDITNGYIFYPPTDKKTIENSEVYDFQDKRTFKLSKNGENYYISGISWRSSVGKTCWIKKIFFLNGKLKFEDCYRWGEFQIMLSDGLITEFYYKKSDSQGNYTVVTKQEIDEFLAQLQ